MSPRVVRAAQESEVGMPSARDRSRVALENTTVEAWGSKATAVVTEIVASKRASERSAN